MGFIYSFAISVYLFLMRFASLFNGKARKWVEGRKGWREDLRANFSGFSDPVWVHCASLGEFEQGRPVIEKLKEKYPGRKILVTFFSPSGYEIMKSWPVADHIAYLPGDTVRNASDFLDIVRPGMAIIVKYEFWNNFISSVHERGIPLYLVSAIFRPGQHFFKWYGKFFTNQLAKFTRIFVQDDLSRQLLVSAGINDVIVSGDSRFDRVAQIASEARDIPLIEKFRAGEKLFLAGSSWPGDEEIIASYINRDPGRMKWVFAPHEIDASNIKRLESLLRTTCARYSDGEAALHGARVLIIDNIGMLSSAYRYAAVAAVGGGFGKGIHNILEPACWGVPVLFGPDHKKFREAVEMISLGGAFTFSSKDEFSALLDGLIDDREFYKTSSETAGKYIRDNTGVTAKIVGGLA